MLKLLLSRMRGLLGLGVPAILSFSSGLPGTGGDDNTPCDESPSPPEALNRRLTRAEAFLEVKHVKEAQAELEAADRISLTLRPHTVKHEYLVRRKTQLWERVSSYPKKAKDKKHR